MTVPVDQHRATIQGLPLDPVEAQPRQVYFFDTPDLALNRAGLVVRARRTQGGRGRHGDQAPSRRARRPARLAAAPGRLQRRGRRPARRLRLLGVAQGPLDRRRGPRRRRPATPPLRRLFSKIAAASSTGRTRPTGLTLDDLDAARPDVPAQVPLRRPARRDEALDPAARRGGVVLPGRLEDPRAVDEVPAARTRSRSRARRAPTSWSAGSTSTASSRRRRRRRSSSTPAPARRPAPDGSRLA